MHKFSNIVIEKQISKSATTTSGTETIDLPQVGFLSVVTIRAAMLGQWVDECALNVWQAITKVELLVNGSQVVKSLTGRQLRALAWYHGLELPPLGTYNRGGTGDKTFWNFPILLGRYPGDPNYMLDLSKYANPQLKITWDAAQSTFDGVSCDITASPTFRYGVDALIMRQGSSPDIAGYIKSSEIDSFTTANSLEHTTEVPRGQELMGIMIGGRYDDIDTPEFFTNIKLDFDNGQWIALDMDFKSLMAFYSLWYPRTCFTSIYQSHSSGDTVDPMLGLVDMITFTTQTAGVQGIQQAGGEYPLYDLNLYGADGTAHATRADIEWFFAGRLPHQELYLPMHAFAGPDIISIPTSDFGRIDLKLTLGSGVGANAKERIVAEYVIPNGL